ncbi:hypothetical protein FOZ62_024669, partial [Perkinsus olseni]
CPSNTSDEVSRESSLHQPRRQVEYRQRSGGPVCSYPGTRTIYYGDRPTRCSSEQHRRASRNLFPAEVKSLSPISSRSRLNRSRTLHSVNASRGERSQTPEGCHGRQRGRRSTTDLRSLVQNVRQELTEQVRAVERRLEGIEQDIGTGGISAKGTLTRSGDLKANDFCCDEEAHAIDLGRSLQEQEERVLRLVGHMVEHLITSETREARMIREAAGVESRTRPPQGQLENTPQSSRPGHQLTCERPSSLDDLRKSIDNLRTLAGRNTTGVCSTAAETAIGAPFLNRETRSDFSPDGAVGGAHLKGCYPADGIRVSQSRLADEKAPPGEDGDDPPHEVDTDLADLLKMRARLEEQLQWMDS